MNKSRLEAFSDGVLAIIITIMVLELKVPEGTSWAVVKPLLPVFSSYLLSFAFIGIYWGNHHHLLHTVKRVNAKIIWANMHLLFWLSLIPFATGWMGVNNYEKHTVALYGVLLVICGIAFTILGRVIAASYKEETNLTRALAKSNPKIFLSTTLYIIAVPIALFISPVISAALYVIVAIMWFIPSKAIEKAISEEDHNGGVD